jgi:hypothetical protein
VSTFLEVKRGASGPKVWDGMGWQDRLTITDPDVSRF